MRRGLLWLMVGLLLLGSLLTNFIWFTLYKINMVPQHPQPKSVALHKTCSWERNKCCSQTWMKEEGKHQKSSNEKPQPPKVKASASCKDCREKIDKVLEFYSRAWRKDEGHSRELRSQLNSQCNGSVRAIVTQTNTPLGSKLVYDGQKKKSFTVNQEMFSTFPMENPFSNKTWQTCSVVGNGGILANSSCGKSIDSAGFIIRCNLPPLSLGYQNDVGVKTSLVTANPSILSKKYGALMERRCKFVETLCQYGSSFLLLPAFSFNTNTALSLRALYTTEDFGSPIRAVFFNPEYLQSLDQFWRSRGLKAPRLSTGIMMVSLALELCENVDLYGFWPFSVHPDDLQELTHHYYDDTKAKGNFHVMPDEFERLVQLHSQGVIRLHLGHCEPDPLIQQKTDH
ncbi:alpha-N-acetylneuraminide alpha-2,8-sialyltransferase [Austrofundulus limnaeus]|uniref:Alpha-N-acetylneuraminide alpha-2,8-sialyltransferase n=1 Tax=Austrofundulus limnaeus TaxID=52670 RepID=A0A2I4CDK7_AUSLI|nr:PREDICTED: alpha-N-acetylneuraminide alpha-2,8-sialyltransferase-like [Austrofundulus limnaeus]